MFLIVSHERYFKKMFARLRRNKTGYSLIEVMTAMAILSIVGSVALPALDNFFSGQKVDALAIQFVSHIRLARNKAIENQAVHRIVFAPFFESYKVEVFSGFNEGATETLATDHPNSTDYDNSDWESIIDTDVADFDSAIEVIPESTLPNCIFFWPNGRLVVHINPSTPLSDANVIGINEYYIMMIYGNAGIRIMLNAFGVFSSESYAPDNDISDDETDSAIW